MVPGENLILRLNHGRLNSVGWFVFFLAAPLLLSGCSVLDGIFKTPSRPDDTEPLRMGSPLPPLDNNRFVFREGVDAVGQLQVIRAKYEDTFVDIARTYGLGYGELVAANPGVDPWLPGEGTVILLPTRFLLPNAAREGIVLNIAVKRLFYFPEVSEGEEHVVETYPIGIGREGWATPTGDTSVISKARNPVWFVPSSVRKEHAKRGDPLPKQMPPGPGNPLGAYALGLGIPGYLIHGTNKPAGVGMRVSHGCVRLFPEHIERLYARVEKGVRVQIVNQPYLLGWQDDELMMEAHPPLAEDERDWSGSLLAQARSTLVDLPVRRVRLDESRIERISADQLGVPFSILSNGKETTTVIRTARYVENIVVSDKVLDYSVD
jgi:L,D-transpeptidase ErfK/SrfK